ncbi:hypothetical protein [Maricaulis alexandrii]|uniref:hypothetical protein n=1 Tax=Maricaulis alexandrii TaxID=2570354 RepID=UPI001108326C|nr:hypothetical protein [Maricaulis alexandrii]
MTREINPMNAVAFAFLVARIRSRAFWILLGWTFVWMVLGFALQLRIMPVPTMDGSGMPADMSGYMLQQLLALGVSAVVWILPFVAWMRLLTLGQDGGPVPLRFGASELWGLITVVALTLAVMGVPVFAILLITALASVHPAFIALTLLMLPLGVFIIYVALRLTPAVALSAMTHEFAVGRAWAGMKGHVTKALLAYLILFVASFVVGIASAVISAIAPGLSMQDEMMTAMLSGEVIDWSAIWPAAAFSALIYMPLTLMSYGLNAYFALAISGRQDDWIREIEAAEASDT